jgi:hypothetical protein
MLVSVSYITLGKIVALASAPGRCGGAALGLVAKDILPLKTDDAWPAAALGRPCRCLTFSAVDRREARADALTLLRGGKPRF